MRSTRKLSLALTGLLPGVLLLLFSASISAQTAEAGHGHVVGQYDVAHELTINGTIEHVITKRTVGSPLGIHLLVSGAEGMVDAHVGPFLTKSMQQAVHAGLPLQIVGSMVTIRGKQMLLARQLIYGGQTVTIRNSSGLLYRPAQSSLSPASRKNSWITRGGAL